MQAGQHLHANTMDRAARMQQQLISLRQNCFLYFAETQEARDILPANPLPVGGNPPAAHMTLLEEWLVGRWGFGPLTMRARSGDDVSKFQSYTRDTAFANVLRVLEVDMAYGFERWPKEQAHRLAVQFMEMFSSSSACFYGNKEWGTYGHGTASYNPIKLPGKREFLFEFVAVGLQPGFIAALACCDDD